MVATNATIHTFVPVLIVLATEGRFGSGLPGDPVLFVVQLRAPLFITFFDFALLGFQFSTFPSSGDDVLCSRNDRSVQHQN